MANFGLPLYIQVAGALRERITDGTYPAGKALPSEGALCNDYGESRMTVRRALAVLCEEGLIVKRRGTPATVRPQVKRKTLVLQRDQRLIGRMPSRRERIELDLDPGVPVLEVRCADGAIELFAADKIEVTIIAKLY